MSIFDSFGDVYSGFDTAVKENRALRMRNAEAFSRLRRENPEATASELMGFIHQIAGDERPDQIGLPSERAVQSMAAEGERIRRERAEDRAWMTTQRELQKQDMVFGLVDKFALEADSSAQVAALAKKSLPPELHAVVDGISESGVLDNRIKKRQSEFEFETLDKIGKLQTAFDYDESITDHLLQTSGIKNKTFADGLKKRARDQHKLKSDERSRQYLDRALLLMEKDPTLTFDKVAPAIGLSDPSSQLYKSVQSVYDSARSSNEELYVQKFAKDLSSSDAFKGLYTMGGDGTPEGDEAVKKNIKALAVMAPEAIRSRVEEQMWNYFVPNRTAYQAADFAAKTQSAVTTGSKEFNRNQEELFKAESAGTAAQVAVIANWGSKDKKFRADAAASTINSVALSFGVQPSFVINEINADENLKTLLKNEDPAFQGALRLKIAKASPGSSEQKALLAGRAYAAQTVQPPPFAVQEQVDEARRKGDAIIQRLSEVLDGKAPVSPDNVTFYVRDLLKARAGVIQTLRTLTAADPTNSDLMRHADRMEKFYLDNLDRIKALAPEEPKKPGTTPAPSNPVPPEPQPEGFRSSLLGRATGPAVDVTVDIAKKQHPFAWQLMRTPYDIARSMNE